MGTRVSAAVRRQTLKPPARGVRFVEFFCCSGFALACQASGRRSRAPLSIRVRGFGPRVFFLARAESASAIFHVCLLCILSCHAFAWPPEGRQSYPFSACQRSSSLSCKRWPRRASEATLGSRLSFCPCRELVSARECPGERSSFLTAPGA